MKALNAATISAIVALAACQTQPVEGERRMVDVGVLAPAGGIAVGGFQYRPKEEPAGYESEEGKSYQPYGFYGTFNVAFADSPDGEDVTDFDIPDSIADQYKTDEGVTGVGGSVGLTYRAHEKVGLFVGLALAFVEEYEQGFVPEIQESFYRVTEDGMQAGVELGAHFFLSDEFALGARYNSVWDSAVISLGFTF